MKFEIEEENLKFLEQDALRVLEKSERQFGHTAINKNKFLKRLLRLPDDTEIKIEDQIYRCQKIMLRSDTRGHKIYSSAKSYLIEKQVAEQLSRLSSTFSLSKTGTKIPASEMRLGRGVRPSSEQVSAVNRVINNGVSIITGGPGTGKTTMVLGLVRALKALKLSVTLCAPTGKAAKRLGEATGLKKFNPSTIHMHLMDAATGTAFNYDVIIVDEASMVDIGLFHSLLATIPDGARLVLIGDKDQLPPVAAGQPFKDIIQTFERQGGKTTRNIRLSPKEGVSGIVSAAYDIINGREPDPEFSLVEHNFEFVECPKAAIGDMLLEYYFERIPEVLDKAFDAVKDEIQILSPQRKGYSGINFLNSEIQHRLNIENTPLHEGKNDKKFFKSDRVMQTSNNYPLGVMNGEVGQIFSKNEDGLNVFVNGQERSYGDDDLEDLELAYAISIHKSQGSEYSSVIIPISSEHSFMLNRSLLYTAVTRGKAKVCLIGERDVFRRTIKNSFKGTRKTGLEIELNSLDVAKNISLSHLTEVYRQKRIND